MGKLLKRILDMTKRSVIYTRVSTDEQAEKGYSLTHQSNECRRYAGINGFSVLEEFCDDYSAATLERPAFINLKEFIDRNKVDAVIVYTADRLSRNIVDFLVLRDQWEKAGIELHYVDRGKSQNTFEGLLTDGIFALLAHGERLKIIERTTNGRHNKARNNRVVMSGITPYGYKRKGKGEDSEYIIDPYEAEVVKNMFEWYVVGYDNNGPLTLRGISNLLDQLGVTPPHNRAYVAPFWHPNSVASILGNPIYTGITYYGKLKTVEGKRVLRPKEEWTLINVPHLAIVSMDIYEAVQKRAERNKEIASRNRKRAYLLSGFFRCAICGHVMFGSTRDRPTKTETFYRCSSSSQKRIICANPKKQTSMRRVDAAVWNWVTSLLEDEGNLDEGIRAMMEKRANELGPKQERLNTLESLLLGADTKIERLIDELSNYEGNAVREAIREKIRSIENERNMLAKEAERLFAELEQIDISPDFEQQIKRAATIIREKLCAATVNEKRMVLEMLELRVQYYYDPDRGEVLNISCSIPWAESEIALSTLQRSSRLGCNFWIRKIRMSL
jgi:site-specific DNA recombinase